MTQPGVERSTQIHPVEAVVVHGTGVQVDRVVGELPRAEVRHRFGGLDVPAVLAGTLAAVGTLVLLSGLATGAGRIGYQQGLRDADTLSIAGLAGGVVVLFLSLLLGGWVAGRMSRYDGVRNGLLAAVVFVLLTAALGALGARVGSQYNVSKAAHLPTWVTGGATTLKAAISGLVVLVVALAAGALGGWLGARWHRKVDDVLLHTTAGGVAPYPSDVAQ